QQIPVSYDRARLDGLLEFAARRRQEFAGQALAVERLTGFCLLVRREVLEKIGVLDERFGKGFFEDDDFCGRARAGGFKLAVCLGVVIDHFGSRTFKALGIDAQKCLGDNFALFRAKWGEARSAGYRAPAGAPALTRLPARPGTRPRVSLTMIVRNEEANLAACLACIIDLVDEIILVDTGSTDRTKEIARQFGDKVKVIDFPWIDDFAAAR